MTRGKNTCKILKEIRRQIAEANDISYVVSECKFKGECSGSCPKCEAEIEYLEQQLNERRLSGKIVRLVGISASVIAMLTPWAAQATPSQFPCEIRTMAPEPESERLAGIAKEQMPEFPGGDKALDEWIYTHLAYPENALKDSIEGRVIVQFVIEETGKVGEVKVVRSKHPELNQAAIDVVKTLPDFIPGRMNDIVVSVWYTLPIRFKLPEKGK